MQSPRPESKTSDPLASDGRQVILVVDDHPAVLSAIESKLGADYRIITAHSALAATTLALADSPDLIVLETKLAELDGFELCRQLKSDPQTEDIPVIFLTAFDAGENEIRGLELGAIDFIVKPIRPAALALRINNHLALKRARDLLYNQSLVDTLTGIGNRRCFEDTFSREWFRAARQGMPISLALIDLDQFRRYNQEFGRAKGDECLKQVARMLKSVLQRWADTPARYGGARFVAILPQTTDDGAGRVAERIQEGLASLALPYNTAEGQAAVTVSIGVASCVPASGQDPVLLLRLADERLVEAKNAGRSQVR